MTLGITLSIRWRKNTMLRKCTFTLLLAAVASLAFAGTMDVHAATLPISAAMQHADIFGSLDWSLLGLGAAAFGTTDTTGSENHAQKSKFFRVALEGATTDGRNISREWIEQMAKNYSPTKYGARLNLEHFRGVLPDGPFKAYGDVIALEARKETGEHAGKFGLYAQITPTPDLVAMTKAKQKIYTSCEVDPNFADTGEAYLVALAVTDSPASLGTEVLSFAAKNPAASPFTHKKQSPTNVFTAAVDEVVIELEPETAPAPSIFKKVGELLGLVKNKTASDDSRFADMTQAVETLATFSSEQGATVKKQADVIEQLMKKVGDQAAALDKHSKDFADLQAKLSTTGNGQATRPTATGATHAVVTDC
jgi:hypothetical protein